MPADLPVAAPDHAERDPFADDVLERLLRSDVQYQQTHGHYIVPLSERLLAVRAERAALLAERQQDKARIERLEKALREIMVEETFPVDNEHGSINVFVADDVCDLARAALAVEEDATP